MATDHQRTHPIFAQQMTAGKPNGACGTPDNRCHSGSSNRSNRCQPASSLQKFAQGHHFQFYRRNTEAVTSYLFRCVVSLARDHPYGQTWKIGNSKGLESSIFALIDPGFQAYKCQTHPGFRLVSDRTAQSSLSRKDGPTSYHRLISADNDNDFDEDNIPSYIHL
jgi:hypothetical protein